MDGALTRRAYALGNFSRFVRPGFQRVKATAAPQSLVELTAFSDPNSAALVVVAINSSSAEKTQTLRLLNGAPTSFTPYTTSASLALEAGEPISVVDGRASVQLAARSITTLVGSL